jgi:hypothetical protein
MGLGILTMLTALSISAVAIYYSVAGLVAIFAAAAVPIIIMGSILEIAKLVTVVWLHYYWEHAVWWLKTYLTISVAVLMLITSMGIFGFLSKAHIDQTASAKDGLARLEQIDSQILRQQDVIVKAEQEIEKLEIAGLNKDTEIQEQIDREQDRIDSAYARIQPAIDEQNEIIRKEEQRLTGSLSIYEDQLVTVDNNLQKIEQYIASNSIKELQALVGVNADGSLGPATRNAIEAFRVAQSTEKQRLAELIASERSKLTSPIIDAARVEIQRLRGLAEQEIASSNELINRLRQQLGTTNEEEVAAEVAQQDAIIVEAEKIISTLAEQKYGLESEYRKLEAEVGPIKYLAEFVYGKSEDKDLLEEAVRWVIILIIFVFDPLAVLLLIASQHTFNFQRELRIKETLRQSNVDSTKDIKNDVSTRSDNEQSDNNTSKTNTTNDSTESAASENASINNGTTEIDDTLSRTRSQNGGLIDDVPIQKINANADATLGELRTEDVASSTIEDDAGLESIEAPIDADRQKRINELNVIESHAENKLAKIQWKQDHPELTIKEFKEAYINGEIDRLPWENYVQNGEQSPNSLWNKIRPNNE